FAFYPRVQWAWVSPMEEVLAASSDWLEASGLVRDMAESADFDWPGGNAEERATWWAFYMRWRGLERRAGEGSAAGRPEVFGGAAGVLGGVLPGGRPGGLRLRAVRRLRRHRVDGVHGDVHDRGHRRDELRR